DARAAATRLVDEVRPDLGLDQQKERGVERGERLADRERPVERRVEEPVDPAHALLGDAVPAHGRGREEHPQPRESRLQLVDQRPRGEALADRHGVDPDRAVAVHVQVDGQPPHPLAERAEVLARAPPLPQEPGKGEHEGHGQDDAVEEVEHLSEPEVPRTREYSVSGAWGSLTALFALGRLRPRRPKKGPPRTPRRAIGGFSWQSVSASMVSGASDATSCAPRSTTRTSTSWRSTTSPTRGPWPTS